MEIFSALMVLRKGKPRVTSVSTSQRPVTQSFDVFFDLRLNKRLSKQGRRWRFETPPHSLWRHCNSHPRVRGWKGWFFGLIRNTDPFDDKSTLVHVITWCSQATSHNQNHVPWRHMASLGDNELIDTRNLDVEQFPKTFRCKLSMPHDICKSFAVLCFVAVMSSTVGLWIFTGILPGCIAGIRAILRLAIY